ncbi:Uncharacterised protein [[Clostridium] sordellii]|uniref:hypothetical protein n=1 Tax=Paraclostridium sordellii TaxID=1505 RepID=UPI0005E98115|nr:hypothetical protein [Paeniclostridium sordellii]MDU4412757.1 hypothetical protein [Paeniclostridium sordellii]MRZ29365.1 hypothetical protein [Paeniclostridium sordellii]CEO35530.1 Uncharacterised protein [[Clostridium] sordellii] [Paeniclostridium sordellii]CEP92741.1 Uncharacterised protein [[Clostridium] sordellii] [Paeniclostridium sordellii]
MIKSRYLISLNIIMIFLGVVSRLIDDTKLNTDGKITNIVVIIIVAIGIMLVTANLYRIHNINDKKYNNLIEATTEINKKNFKKGVELYIIREKQLYLILSLMNMISFVIVALPLSSLNINEISRVSLFGAILYLGITLIISIFRFNKFNVYVTGIILVILYLYTLMIGSCIFGFIGIPNQITNELIEGRIIQGFAGFFNYPDNVNYFNITQFMLGKFMEWFFFGAVSALLINQLNDKN